MKNNTKNDRVDIMKECRDCIQPIKDKAIKCNHCGAYQNWLRFIGTGTLLAGFVLTWISIWAASPIKDAIEPKHADLKISILDSDYSHITFMISNVGNRSAGLVQIEIEAKGEFGPTTWYLNSELDKQLLDPGKAYIVEASNNHAIPKAHSQEVQAYLSGKGIKFEKNCDLVLQYVQLNGNKEYLYYSFPCDKVEPISEFSFK